MRRQLGLIGLALVLCAADAAPRPEITLVNESAAVAGCERLGEVRGGSMWGGAMSGIAYGRALNQLKKRAGDLGATHVHLLDSATSFGGSNMLGVAYRCPSDAAAKAPV